MWMVALDGQCLSSKSPSKVRVQVREVAGRNKRAQSLPNVHDVWLICPPGISLFVIPKAKLKFCQWPNFYVTTETSSCHGDPAPPTPCASCAPALELSFEYLMPSGNKVSRRKRSVIFSSALLKSMNSILKSGYVGSCLPSLFVPP